MQTQSNPIDSSDSIHLAYGREVAELLSQSSSASWMNDLWVIYSGYMAAQAELGYDRRANDVFTSFKELLFFFQRVGEMKN